MEVITVNDQDVRDAAWWSAVAEPADRAARIVRTKLGDCQARQWLLGRWHNGPDVLAEHPEIDYYLFGHRHLLIDLALRGDKRIVILGDWLQYNSFAVWDGTSLFVDQFIEDEA